MVTQLLDANLQPVGLSLSGDGRVLAYRVYPAAGCSAFVHDRQAGTTECACRSDQGRESNQCGDPVVSPDGSAVVFAHRDLAPLVAGLPVAEFRLYLRDRAKGTIEAVPWGERFGLESSGVCGYWRESPAWSHDGRFLLYRAGYASPWGYGTVVLDRQTGLSTPLASPIVNLWMPSISADGRYAAGGANVGTPTAEARVYDLHSGTFEAIALPVAVDLTTVDLCSIALSADGRYVALEVSPKAGGPDLVHGLPAVFVRDRQGGLTERIGVGGPGDLHPWEWCSPRLAPTQADSWSQALGGLSAGAREILLESLTPYAVADDTNGACDLFLRVRGTPAHPMLLAAPSGPYHGWAAAGSSALVRFDASGSLHPQGLPLTATWDFGDGTPPVSAPASQPVDHAYAAAGSYAVRLVVSDGVTASEPATTPCEILEAAAPRLAAVPACGDPGAEIRLLLEGLPLAPAAGGWNESGAAGGRPPPIAPGLLAGPATLGFSGPSGPLFDLALQPRRVSRRSALEADVELAWGIPSSWGPGRYRISTAGAAPVDIEVPCAHPDVFRYRPRARPGGPYSASAGQAVAFDGSGSTDPRGLPLQYAWDFGDGTTGTGALATHVYPAPGSYLVSLEVTNGTYRSSCRAREPCYAEVVVGPSQPPDAPSVTRWRGSCGCGGGGGDALGLLLGLLALRARPLRFPARRLQSPRKPIGRPLRPWQVKHGRSTISPSSGPGHPREKGHIVDIISIIRLCGAAPTCKCPVPARVPAMANDVVCYGERRRISDWKRLVLRGKKALQAAQQKAGPGGLRIEPVIRGVSEPTGRSGSPASRPGRLTSWSATPGAATSASRRTPSSTPWPWPPAVA